MAVMAMVIMAMVGMVADGVAMAAMVEQMYTNTMKRPWSLI